MGDNAGIMLDAAQMLMDGAKKIEQASGRRPTYALFSYDEWMNFKASESSAFHMVFHRPGQPIPKRSDLIPRTAQFAGTFDGIEIWWMEPAS